MISLSEHIMDIAQNSVNAKSTLIKIRIEKDKKNDLCRVEIQDNGCGMSEDTRRKATNPFFTTRKTRKVGLGLALLQQNAEQAGGSFKLESVLNKGTKVLATFQLSNVDRPKLGDVWNTYYLLLIANPEICFEFEFATNNGCFEISSEDIREIAGDVSLQNGEFRKGILQLIENNIKELQ